MHIRSSPCEDESERVCVKERQRIEKKTTRVEGGNRGKHETQTSKGREREKERIVERKTEDGKFERRKMGDNTLSGCNQCAKGRKKGPE